MIPNGDVGMVDMSEHSTPTKQNDLTSERKSRKRRARLSCAECRNKKLSCDRNLPCQRCVRTGRSAQCSFETLSGEQTSTFNISALQQQKRIDDLQAQVAELKALLSKAPPTREAGHIAETTCAVEGHAKSNVLDPSKGKLPELENSIYNPCDENDSRVADNLQPHPTPPTDDKPDDSTIYINNAGLSDPMGRFPQGYYSRHNLFQFFGEIRELFPFIRETANEWFKPLGVTITKPKSIKRSRDVSYSLRKGAIPEILLPPKEDADALISFYLDGLERIHRIVHIPTFKRDYEDFWLPERPRHPAMTALVLAMISISTCTATRSAEAASIPIKYRAMCGQWIHACEKWLKHQSTKHRKIVYYQVSCLVYQAKRIAMIGKKGWWKETSSLIQDAIIDGIHCELSSSNGTPFIREMKRRIWAVLRELDLQNAFEYGLPTLLHNINSDISPPMNIEDDAFNETSKEIATPKPLEFYTFTSYQVHSACSWVLRLEISQRLFSGRLSKDISYDEVLRYTHEITQAIETVPSWDVRDSTTINDYKLPTVANAFCLFQLKECILALHRPYLYKNDCRYWLSETVCYHTSRDVLLLNTRLAELGCQSLTVIRDDLLLASLSLVRMTMLQPKLSNSIIVTDSQSTVDLLERCVPLMEDRHLRCCYSELWCFITMYAAIMLLKVHLEKESRQTAKAVCARRFLDLHYRQMERQKMTLNQQILTPSDRPNNTSVDTCQPNTLEMPDFLVPGWLDDGFPGPEVHSLSFDDMDSTWSAWEPL
ncbi:hypothetical protein F5Y11DRAFT_118830 [Daldinia sp. FL1419]|nr:hypothetical protein F5Y11DRAFT_118830 [Daldinia sp. FL1419]